MAVDLNLPLVGEPDTNGTLANWISTLRIESNTVRDEFTEDDALCAALYYWGSSNGETDPDAYNKTMNMVQAFVEQVTKTPPVRSLKMINKFAAPMMPGSVLSGLDGQTIQGPPQPMTVANSSGELVPFNSDLITDFYQHVFDVKMEQARADRSFKRMATKSKIFGWMDKYIQWNADEQKIEFKIIPHLQWYKAPECEDIEDMSYVGVDIPWPLDMACQEFPNLEAILTENARMGTPTPTSGSDEYSYRYTGFSWNRPVVQVSVFHLRNRMAKMTDQEAIRKGIIVARVHDDSTLPTPPVAVSGDTQPVSELADGSPSDLSTAEPQTGDNWDEPVIETGDGADDTGEDMFAPQHVPLFLVKTGKEVTPESLDWPIKRVLNRVILVENKVVENSIAKTWDIPVVTGYNVQFDGRPYGMGAPLTVRNQQGQINKTYGICNRHVEWFQGPSSIVPRSIKDDLPDGGRNFNLHPNVTYTVDDEVFKALGGKVVQRIETPEISDTILTVASNLEMQFDTAGGYSKSQQGETPTSNASGELVQALQEAGASTANFMLEPMRDMLWRESMICFYMTLTGMSADDLYRLNQEFDLTIVEQMRKIALESEWGFDIELANSQVKAQRENAVRQDYAAGLISKETALDKLNYDSALEKGRAQEEMASAAVAGASQGGMPGIQGKTRKQG